MVPPDFVPPDFVVPTEVVFDDIRLVPLGPEHNAADHAAWTSSIEHIRATPGFPDGSWPRLMSLDENFSDLQRHAGDFRQRRGFTYTVLDASNDVIGCLYIYPSKEDGVDAIVQSWVRADRSELDQPLAESIRAWLESDWPFQAIDYTGRDAS
jgi:hypothetical protein